MIIMEKTSINFTFLAASQMITVICGFAINIFLSRYLGLDLYGQYSLIIIGIMAIGLQIIATGFPETMSKFISEEKEEAINLTSQFLTFQIIESIIITIIFLAVSPLLSFIFDDIDVMYLVLLASFLIIGQGLVSFFVLLYNGLRKFVSQAIIVSLYAILKLGFVIIGAYFWSVPGAILGFIISTLLIAFIFVLISRKYLGTKLRFTISKKIITYVLQITLFYLGIALITSLDLIFIKFILSESGDDVVGIYNAGATISRLSYFLIMSFSGVMFPTISNLITNENHEQAKKEIGSMIKISSIFLIPFVFSISSASDKIISILYKPEFSESAVISRYLVFGYSILGFFVIFSNLINAIGDVKISIFISLGIIVVDIILLYIMITYIGLIGATIATIITSFIGLIIMIIFVIKKIGITINIVSIIRIIISGMLIFGVLNYILNIFDLQIYYWILIFLAEIVIYFVILAVFKDFNVFKLSKKIIKKYFIKNKIAECIEND